MNCSAKFYNKASQEQYRTKGLYINKRQLIEKYGDNPETLSEWLANQYCLSKQDSILELGCGPAEIWQFLLERGKVPGQLMLTDVCENMLQEACEIFKGYKSNLSVSFCKSNINDEFSFQTNTFTGVMAHLMLYHANSLQDTLDKIMAVIRPKGWLGVSTLSNEAFAKHLQLAHSIDSSILANATSSVTPNKLENMLTPYFNEVKCKDYQSNIRWPPADIAMQFTRLLVSISAHNPTQAFYDEYEQRVSQ